MGDRDRLERLIGIAGMLTAYALVNRCVNGTFQEAFEMDNELADSAAIAAFIVRCPSEMRPSINKALFFIDAGGFTVDLLTVEEAIERRYTVSPATIRKAWASCAASATFTLAADRLDIEFISKLAPDDETSISEASKILDDLPRARRYFGGARYIQEILLTRLDVNSRKKINFLTFPDCIQVHAIEPRAFNAAQLDIIKRYRAPKFLAE
jgi:hypothetical protein